MAIISEFSFTDLLEMNFVNLDQLTETYTNSFYGEYLTHWPEYQRIARHPTTGTVMGYILGKVEGEGEDWHGHTSAVTVAPTFRRVGLAETLMSHLERISEEVHNAYFADLFVRESNRIAIQMYQSFGYNVYRKVIQYYHSGGPFTTNEDALDMRKALRRDKQRSKSSVIPLTRPIRPEELEWQ
jgi:N-terminal acetyltransferase B complex catalytic subunit